MNEKTNSTLQEHVDRIVDKKQKGIPLNEAERRFWSRLRRATQQTPEAKAEALSAAEQKRARRAAKRAS